LAICIAIVIVDEINYFLIYFLWINNIKRRTHSMIQSEDEIFDNMFYLGKTQIWFKWRLQLIRDRMYNSLNMTKFDILVIENNFFELLNCLEYQQYEIMYRTYSIFPHLNKYEVVESEELTEWFLPWQLVFQFVHK